MARVRIAVAGAGLIGRRHVRQIRESAACELAGIADPAPAASELAREAGVPIHRSLAELLEATRPDGVIVATPNRLHVEHGLQCVRRGIPALIEKPIADSVEEATRLADAAARAGVRLLVGHHRRHNPVLAKAREIVRAGTLGRIVAVMASALFYKPQRYFDEGPWRREPGGGPILINLIHGVDDLRFVCGEITAVQAFSSTATRGFAVEDTAAMNLRFAGGALGTFLLSDTAAAPRSWEQTSQEDPGFAHHPDEDCYLIAGTRGSLAVPTMRLVAYRGEPSWWEPSSRSVVKVDRADPYSRQLEHFCAMIRGDAEPLVSAGDAIRTLQVTLAVAEAARSGRVVATA